MNNKDILKASGRYFTNLATNTGRSYTDFDRALGAFDGTYGRWARGTYLPSTRAILDLHLKIPGFDASKYFEHIAKG